MLERGLDEGLVRQRYQANANVLAGKPLARGRV